VDGYLVRQVSADAADLDALVRHRVGMFTDMGTAVADADRPQFREWFIRALASGAYRAWVAVAPDGTIVAGGGVAILLWPPGPGGTGGALPFVYNVYTEPAHRRRGAARLIMATIHEWCRAAGYQRVGLAASRFGEPLYLDMGYRPPPQPFLFLDLPAATAVEGAGRMVSTPVDEGMGA
jgi:GNAT superfamily N-acetyltransferase